MDKIEIIGIIAGFLTTAAFVPQVYKTWREKSTKDVSLSMYTVLFMGVLLWLLYGINIQSISVILTNATTSLLVLIMILLKLRYK